MLIIKRNRTNAQISKHAITHSEQKEHTQNHHTQHVTTHIYINKNTTINLKQQHIITKKTSNNNTNPTHTHTHDTKHNKKNKQINHRPANTLRKNNVVTNCSITPQPTHHKQNTPTNTIKTQ